MKLFKKTYPLVGIMLLLCGEALFAIDADQKKVMKLIADTQARVFMFKGNIFADAIGIKGKRDTEKIGERDFIDWSKMLGEVEDYVDANAGGNKKLFRAYRLCRRFSDKLFSTISFISDVVFSKKLSEKYEIGSPIDSLRDLRKNKLDTLKRMSRRLENTKFHINARKKNNTKEVLLYLIKVLESALDKTWGDYDNFQSSRRRSIWASFREI